MSSERKLVRGSRATYATKGRAPNCDLVELATLYSSVGNIPERLVWASACEVALLAQHFLLYYNELKKPRKRK